MPAMRPVAFCLGLLVILLTSRTQAGLIILPGDVESQYVRDVVTTVPNVMEDRAYVVGNNGNGVQFQGTFFGQTYNTIYASENGNLNFGGNGSFSFNAPRFATIAPFWDDVLWGDGISNRITEYFVPGNYLAVTWANIRLADESPAPGIFSDTSRSAQVVWFQTDTTLRGYDFKAGDVAFGHVGHEAGTANFGEYVYAKIGLDNGVNAFVAPLGGPSDGVYAEYGFASNFTSLAFENDSFLLFSPTAANTYTPSKVSFAPLSSVPEPSSFLLVLLTAGVGAIGRMKCKRRDHTHD